MVSTEPFPGPQESADLEVVLRWEGADCVLMMSGELDIATRAAFDGFIAAAVAVHGSVIVDLRGVSFADPMGLTPLVRHMTRAKERGDLVRVRNLPSSVERMVRALPALAKLLDQPGTLSAGTMRC